jgi:hypothetical protein
MWTKYGKFIWAALYAVAVVVVPLVSDDHHISGPEAVAIAIAVCTALLTYIIPLVPSAPWTKTAVGAVLAGLQVLATVLDGGVSGNDWLLILAAVAGAAGIAAAPAISPKTQIASGAGTSLR